MSDYEMPPDIKRLAELAESWQYAVHNDAFGMGAGSKMMLDAMADARLNFIEAARNLTMREPARLADALAALLRYERRAAVSGQIVPSQTTGA